MTFTLFSCSRNETIKREVILGFNLGSSIKETQQKFDDLYEQGKINRVKDNTPYIIHQLQNGKKYYSIPIYSVRDTIVSEFKLVYTGNENEISSIDNNIRNGMKTFNLTSDETIDDTYSTKILKKDIIDNLNKTYGNYSRIDTLNNISSNVFYVYHWDNKNGVDITLEQENSGPPSELSGNSLLILKYRYIEELFNKLPLGKSIY